MDAYTRKMWGRMQVVVQRWNAAGRYDEAADLVTRWIVWSWRNCNPEGWFYHEQDQEER